MKRFYLVVCLFLMAVSGFSQEKLIQGRIIVDFDEEDLEETYITNTRSKFTTITDKTGRFSIKAQAGDSLLIRSPYYESRRFLITENLMDKKLVTIHLNLQSIVLDAAVLSQKLTGYLDKDARYKSEKDVVAKLHLELGINPDASKLRDSSNFTLGKDIGFTHMNVEKLLEVFTGDLRRRQNLYEYEGRENKIEHIQEYFGEGYFVNDLRIPKEKIRDFVFFAYGSSDTIPALYENKNFLAMMLELNKMATQYLSRLKPWYVKPD